MPKEKSPSGFARLVILARELGADSAKIVHTKDIVVDKRVRLKCAVPLCADYGKHLLCPPNLMSVDEFSEILRLYKWAILVQIEAGTDSTDKSKKPLRKQKPGEIEFTTGSARWERKLHELVNQLETIAFKDGHYLAAGFIGGNCCICRECVGQGKLCRHPFDARPSMEAMGVDVIETCRRAGMQVNLSSKTRVRWTGMVLLM